MQDYYIVYRIHGRMTHDAIRALYQKNVFTSFRNENLPNTNTLFVELPDEFPETIQLRASAFYLSVIKPELPDRCILYKMFVSRLINKDFRKIKTFPAA